MLSELPPPERADLEAKITAVDPLRFAPVLREKARQGKVIMINAAEDEVIPRASTEKLAAAMGLEDRVVWLPDLGHYTSMAELPRTLRMIADFFAQDLPPNTMPPVIENKSNAPLQVLAGVLQQVAVILADKPEEGRCHLVDLQITITPNGQMPQEGRFRLVRGSQGKFALFCKLPNGGQISLGQNDHPWLATGKKEVIEGTEHPGPVLKDPLELINPRQVKLLRMLAGLLNGVAMAPEVIERLIVIEDEGMTGGVRVIRISAREKIPGSVRLELIRGLSRFSRSENGTVPFKRPEEYTPQSLTFNFPIVEGKVKFLGWQINAVAQDAMFEPPAELPRRQVDQSFLYSLFSTSLKYVLPTVEQE